MKSQMAEKKGMFLILWWQEKEKRGYTFSVEYKACNTLQKIWVRM